MKMNKQNCIDRHTVVFRDAHSSAGAPIIGGAQSNSEVFPRACYSLYLLASHNSYQYVFDRSMSKRAVSLNV